MSELTTLFQNTADAIRSKTGDTAPMQASQFPAKIQGISVGISQDEADARYLQLAGGTMTGALTLSGAPTSDLQAATKKYVDDKSSGGGDLTDWSTTTLAANTVIAPLSTLPNIKAFVLSADFSDNTAAAGTVKWGNITNGVLVSTEGVAVSAIRNILIPFTIINSKIYGVNIGSTNVTVQLIAKITADGVVLTAAITPSENVKFKLSYI